MKSLPRNKEGKPAICLVDPGFIRSVARVMGFGVEKYGLWDWMKGYDFSTCYDCTQRHLLAWWDGEDLDPESGEHHLAHAAANLMMLLFYHRQGRTDLDNRPEFPSCEGKNEKDQTDQRL